jgi:rhodanese-related sulfurtransferase
MSDSPASRHRGRSRILAALLVAGVVLGGAYLALEMPGTDDGTSGNEQAGDHPSTRFERLSPDEFAARLADSSATVVNVHTPYEGEIAGTDLFIPYDTIRGDARLPADKDTEILLYCRSGRMSATAARSLVDAGYTNVADLAGGMDAWESSGRIVETDLD